METITLENNFHNSSIALRPSKEGRLSASQVKRTKKTLCGITGCTCSGALGTRRPQESQIEVFYLPDQWGMFRVAGAYIFK